MAKFPLPPKVIVPIVSTETLRPELPNCRYSIVRSSLDLELFARGLTCQLRRAKVAARADNTLVSVSRRAPRNLFETQWKADLPLAGLYAHLSAVPTDSHPQELALAFASLRRLAFAAIFSAAALAAHGALAAATAPEPDRTVDMATVLKPGPLPELAMGDPSGVPVIEYGSLTCPHCATFSREVFPELKKDYIDTGKVHFIFREFSRNPLDVAAFVLARCIGDDKAFAAIELLFSPAGQVGVRRQAARAADRRHAPGRPHPR